MSLEYKPSSKPLHISAKQIFSDYHIPRQSGTPPHVVWWYTPIPLFLTARQVRKSLAVHPHARKNTAFFLARNAVRKGPGDTSRPESVAAAPGGKQSTRYRGRCTPCQSPTTQPETTMGTPPYDARALDCVAKSLLALRGSIF